ncbi:hypothetical protein HCN44_011292 [Aphidius gifuensis]|uniref:Odorant-binding protein n=1 Tax=Aphidius gifuensis TaxID=684658 RepID=A0A835CU62_APHGI|nr:hypothetical protein HCN44_011292 [Aphidius gifuensis]
MGIFKLLLVFAIIVAFSSVESQQLEDIDISVPKINTIGIYSSDAYKACVRICKEQYGEGSKDYTKCVFGCAMVLPQ